MASPKARQTNLPVHYNKRQAGFTLLMESMACWVSRESQSSNGLHLTYLFTQDNTASYVLVNFAVFTVARNTGNDAMKWSGIMENFS